MIIHTLTLEGTFGRWWGIHTFTQITDDNGKTLELKHNSKEVDTLDALNEIYKEYLRMGTDMKRKTENTHITIDEYIDRLENSIDKYVEYIDNGRQYREAVESNRKIEAKIKKYKALKEEGVE